MTVVRKPELRQLLGEAMESLEIRDEYGGGQSALPVDVYRRHLEESWKYFGLARFSPFWIRPTVNIVCQATRLHVLDFIREELALFIDNDEISTATYFIESNSTDSPRVHRFKNKNKGVHPRFILKRLLDIALVRGIEGAVSVFGRCSRPEGAQGVFQDVSVVKGITLKTDIEVFKGIRLVPLLDSGISKEFISYFRFPVFAFGYEFPNFFGQTLLAIDRPGFSIFHKPGPNQEFPQGLPVGELPFQVGEHDTIFRDRGEVDSFQESFSQALSLILNFPIQIPRGAFCFEEVQISRGGYFFEEDRTFNPRDGTIASLIPANQFRDSIVADEDHIEKAKCLYKRLVGFDSNDWTKLQIAIGRWIKSKASESYVDKIIDLGIAFEALYLPGIKDELAFRLRVRAAWYLGTDEDHRKELLTKLKNIYDARSSAVHSGKLGPTVKFGEQHISVSDFITTSQDLCRQSIMKVLTDGCLPDDEYWNSLILGGDVSIVPTPEH